MEKFTIQWLDAREPEDLASRCKSIIRTIDRHFCGFEQLNILDIGCGTGSTMRAVLPYLTSVQHWNFVDHNSELLDLARHRNTKFIDNTPHTMKFQQQNLAENYDYICEKKHIVTASALLDLVSKDWLHGLVGKLNECSCSFYGAHTVSGMIEIVPGNKMDDEIFAAFHLHHQTDKGFGPALGQDANHCAKSAFENQGYVTHVSRYQWGTQNILTENRRDLYPQFVTGIADAVMETGLVNIANLQEWQSDRLSSFLNGIGEIRVVQEDLLAIPKHMVV